MITSFAIKNISKDTQEMPQARNIDIPRHQKKESFYSLPSTSVQLQPVFVCKKSGELADSVHSDQMPRSATSDLDLHCFLMPVCPSTRNVL